jgi:hypothetical protein
MPPKRPVIPVPEPAAAAASDAKTEEPFSDVGIMIEPIIIPSEPVHVTPRASNTLQLHPETTNLPDVPIIYLTERSGWIDFKRALNECGMAWNFAGWMTTIVYKGKEWKEMLAKGHDLSQYFPSTEKRIAGDGVESKTSQLSAKLLGLLDLPRNVSEFHDCSLQFCNLATVEFEPERKLPARQKFWAWFVRALRGPKTAAGPYYYLVDEVQRYDIAYLFKRLCQVLEQVTICSLDDELEGVIKLDFKPQTQNIFAYYADLRKAVKRLHDVNDRLPESARVVLPDAYLRSRMVRAARQVPVFKPVIDALLMKRPEEWGKITVEELYHQFEQVCANDLSSGGAGSTSKYRPPTNTDDTVAANAVNVHTQKKNDEKRSCHNFSKHGTCKRNNCSFLHVTPNKNVEEKKDAKPRPPLTCMRCGENHTAKECKFNGKCGWCKRNGHKENVCIQKKSGKPQVLAAVAEHADGGAIRANLLFVDDGTISDIPQALNSYVADGKIRETFFADTGANRSIHPNTKASSSFYRIGLEIGTKNFSKRNVHCSSTFFFKYR